jgi:hypothetical protein
MTTIWHICQPNGGRCLKFHIESIDQKIVTVRGVVNHTRQEGQLHDSRGREHWWIAVSIIRYYQREPHHCYTGVSSDDYKGVCVHVAYHDGPVRELIQSLVVYRISTRACHQSVRARAGFDSPPGSLFFVLFLLINN